MTGPPLTRLGWNDWTAADRGSPGVAGWLVGPRLGVAALQPLQFLQSLRSLRSVFSGFSFSVVEKSVFLQQ